MSKILYIQGIYNELAGRRDQALAELHTYLDDPVGIGEHSDISTEIKKKLSEIAHAENQLVVLQRYFGDPKSSNTEASISEAPEDPTT